MHKTCDLHNTSIKAKNGQVTFPFQSVKNHDYEKSLKRSHFIRKKKVVSFVSISFVNQTSSLVPAVDNMQTLQTKWKKSKKVSISGGHIFLSTLVNSFCQMTENFGFPEYTHSWSPLSAYFFHYYSFFEVGARVVKIYEIPISLCFLYHYPLV